MTFLKGEEKQLLLDCYEDIEWCGDVAQQQCVHCHRVAINHYVSNCQHIFCHNCKEGLENGGQLKCSQCQEYVTKLDDQDFDVEVKVHQLKIFCPNKKYGCNYADQLRKIPSHLMTCAARQEESLPVDSKVKNTMEDLVDQLTSLIATAEMLRERMAEMNNKVEEKFNQLERKTDDLDRKINVLTDRLTNGDKKVSSVKLELASEESRSIKSLLESINEGIRQNGSLLQQKMEQMSLKMASMTLEKEAVQHKKSEEFKPLKDETYEWTLQNVSEIIFTENETWRCESRAFRFAGYEYDVKAILEKQKGNNGDPIIYLQFENGGSVNKFLTQNRFATIEYIVRNQTIDPYPLGIKRETEQRFYDRFGLYDCPIFQCTLPDQMLGPSFFKNDSINITISLKRPSINHNFFSNNGILMWKVVNYKQRAWSQWLYETWSPVFYTSPQGYRVKMQLSINSSQVFVYFLTDEHSNTLSRDFPHVTTVTLINITDSSKTLVKSVQRNDLKLYAIQLEKCKFDDGFIQDDSLLLKVVIEPVVSK